MKDFANNQAEAKALKARDQEAKNQSQALKSGDEEQVKVLDDTPKNKKILGLQGLTVAEVNGRCTDNIFNKLVNCLILSLDMDCKDSTTTSMCRGVRLAW